MGNVASVKLKEDTRPLEITEKLVRDFQYHIKLVDHSMTAFARTTESLRETFSTVQQRENRENNLNVNDGANNEELLHTTNYMRALEKIEEALSDQSVIVMDSLSRLLTFIIETGNKCNISLPERALHFVEIYKSGTFADALEKDMQYHDAIVESMQKKLERANTRYKMAKDDIDNLIKRELLYQKEKLILKDTVRVLDTGAVEMKMDLEKVSKEVQELERRNMDMKTEICTLERNIENLESNLSSEKLEVETLHENLIAEKDKHFKHTEELNQKMEDLQRKLNVRQNKIDSLETDIRNERQCVEALKKDASIKIESLENEKQKLNNDYRQLNAFIDEDKKRLEELLQGVRDNNAAEGEKILESIKNTLIEYQPENRKQMIAHETRYKTIVSDEISKVNTRIDEVTQSMRSLDKGLKNVNNEGTDFKNAFLTENRRLSSCLVQSKLEEGNYIKAIYQMRDQIQQITEENASLLVKVDTFEKERTELVEKEKSSASQEQSYAEISDKFRLEIETLRQKVEEHLQILEDFLKTSVASENKQTELLLNLLSKCESGMPLKEDNYSRFESLQAEMSALGQDYKKLKEFLMKEMQDVEDKPEKVIKKTQNVVEVIESPQKVVEEQREEIKSLNREIRRLTDENELSKEEINSLTLQLGSAAMKTLIVQIIHYPKFDAKEIEDQLQKTLQLRFVGVNTDLLFMDMTGAYVLRSDFPVLVLCPRSFGVNRDKNITSVIQQYKDKKMNKMTALVFFHDKDEKKFKKEDGGMGSCRSRIICNIFDILYSKQKISECDENATNIEKLQEFLKTTGKRTLNDVESAV